MQIGGTMDWSKMTPNERLKFLKSIEGQTVFAHSSSWRIWGVMYLFGPYLELSFGCRQLGMDSKGSAMIFFSLGQITNAKETEAGPGYTIFVDA